MFFISTVELEECSLLPSDRKMCKKIFIVVLLECLVVFSASASILQCVWSPSKATHYDFDKLARITYLYDYEACEHQVVRLLEQKILDLSTDVENYTDIKPLPRLEAKLSVSIRISQITRQYVEVSIGVNAVWLLTAIALWIFSRPTTINFNILNYVMLIFFLTTIAVIIFDLSMGLVYITHIKQSLSNSMVLRYSGWSLDMKLSNPNAFAGWLPIVASSFWVRGIIILIYNIYCCKWIFKLRTKIQRKEIKERLEVDENVPFPYPSPWRSYRNKVLFYRSGELEPQIGYRNDFV